MSLIEKTLAEELVEYRAELALGQGYITLTTLIDALQRHLDHEQAHRAAIAALIDGDT